VIGGSILHGTVSSVAVIIFLELGEDCVKRGGDRGRNIVHGTVSSAAEIILLLFGKVGVKRGGNNVETLCMEQ